VYPLLGGLEITARCVRSPRRAIGSRTISAVRHAPKQFDDGIDVLRAANVNADPAGYRHDVMGLRLSRRH
jgi:hypothetical protein